MPLDSAGYLSPRVLTEDEADDLAVLKAARHSLRWRWRWWQGHAKPFSHCALTAVAAALQSSSVASLIRRRAFRDDAHRTVGVQQRLTDNLPPGWANVAAFNDHSTTRHSDVLQLFDRAIADLE